MNIRFRRINYLRISSDWIPTVNYTGRHGNGVFVTGTAAAAAAARDFTSCRLLALVARRFATDATHDNKRKLIDKHSAGLQIRALTTSTGSGDEFQGQSVIRGR